MAYVGPTPRSLEAVPMARCGLDPVALQRLPAAAGCPSVRNRSTKYEWCRSHVGRSERTRDSEVKLARCIGN